MLEKDRSLNLKLIPPGTWVSWVSAVSSVLKSRKVKRSLADVAGMSGYAFVVNVHPELCPSGPTVFDWEMLVHGTSALGLGVELVSAPRNKENDARLMRELFDRVKEEIDAGRCCIVWGAACAPEFGVVYGYTSDSYLVRTFATCRALGAKAAKGVGPQESPEPAVRFDKLEAPGSLSVFLFGDPVKTVRDKAERDALTRAAQLLRDRHPCLAPGYSHGAAGFKLWADALDKSAAKVNPFGNAYNTLGYQELQQLGGDFLAGLSKRHKKAAKPLAQAAQALVKSARNLEAVTRLFPFPEGKGLDDKGKTREAAGLLRECATLNEAAAAALERALGLM